jgi:CRP/FNR family cyclic AMP-dependent transcriptional regulator
LARTSRCPRGFLVLEGCIAREVSILGQTAAVEFLAEGDLLRPSGKVGAASVDSRVVWRALEPTRLAVLDRDFLLTVKPWPELTAGLLERQERRADWLANVLAISHLAPAWTCESSSCSGCSPTGGGRFGAMR